MSAGSSHSRDLLNRLGIEWSRVITRPAPGTATVEDILEYRAHLGRVCEVIDGVLVERLPSVTASSLTQWLGSRLVEWEMNRSLGVLRGAGHPFELLPGVARVPDLTFTLWERIERVELLLADSRDRDVPDLAVDVLRPTTSRAEMIVKRDHYFRAGVLLAWEVDPVRRIVVVSTSPTQHTTLAVGDTLDGGTVLPGFSLSLAELFSDLGRHG